MTHQPLNREVCLIPYLPTPPRDFPTSLRSGRRVARGTLLVSKSGRLIYNRCLQLLGRQADNFRQVDATQIRFAQRRAAQVGFG